YLYLFKKNEKIMSTTMMYEIDSTTARVVARPTPSAPPVTEKPVVMPIRQISTANTKALATPCQTSPGVSSDNVCMMYAAGVTFSAGDAYNAAPLMATT